MHECLVECFINISIQIPVTIGLRVVAIKTCQSVVRIESGPDSDVKQYVYIYMFMIYTVYMIWFQYQYQYQSEKKHEHDYDHKQKIYDNERVNVNMI